MQARALCAPWKSLIAPGLFLENRQHKRPKVKEYRSMVSILSSSGKASRTAGTSTGSMAKLKESQLWKNHTLLVSGSLHNFLKHFSFHHCCFTLPFCPPSFLQTHSRLPRGKGGAAIGTSQTQENGAKEDTSQCYCKSTILQF